MAEAITVSGPVSGTDKTLSFETGKLAFQSQGAVVAKIAGTEALVTANAAKGVREGIDFFPLTVDVEERMYAAGRIPGSFFRREGRPTDAAILACRLIDRPAAPVLRRRVPQRDPDRRHGHRLRPREPLRRAGHQRRLRAPLSISGIPFQGPIGAVRIAYSQDGTWVPHPTFEEVEESTFELIVAGRGVGDDVAIMMVEAGGTEKAWSHYEAGAPKVTEEVIADGLEACKVWIKESIELQKELIAKVEAGRGITPLQFSPSSTTSDDVYAKVEAIVGDDLGQAGTIAGKAERNAATDAAIAKALERAGRGVRRARARRSRRRPAASRSSRSAPASSTRASASTAVARPTCAPSPPRSACSPPPTAPGCSSGARPRCSAPSPSACRRWTSCSTTWATSPRSATCTTTTCRPTPTARRAAWAAPSAARSATASSPSGPCCRWCPPSRSGRTPSGSCPRCSAPTAPPRWARSAAPPSPLMDGGVPIKAPVAGIAMGLIYEDGKYTTLTDILGTEDAFGDMDFKVAGTREFVTALQLDTKIDGLPADVLAQALQQAKEARLAILDVMAEGHRRAPRRGGRDRPEGRQLRDPDRQDRRGHRAEGQGHQRHPGRDRRRHLRRRRRHGRHGHDRQRRQGAPSRRPSARSSSSSTRPPPTSARCTRAAS